MAGIAQTIRLASHYPAAFHKWSHTDLKDVTELQVGTKVLLLPQETDDYGWQCVVLVDAGLAEVTWVHPETLGSVFTAILDVVTVGHAKQRSGCAATHCIGPTKPGTRFVGGGQLVLDARWEGRGDGDERCTGFCSCVVEQIASDPQRMAGIMSFAFQERSGWVVCNRAKHRSVAASRILEYCFNRRVNYDFAVQQRRCAVCASPAHSAGINRAIRSLPRCVTRPLAAQMTWLGPDAAQMTCLGPELCNPREVKSLGPVVCNPRDAGIESDTETCNEWTGTVDARER